MLPGAEHIGADSADGAVSVEQIAGDCFQLFRRHTAWVVAISCEHNVRELRQQEGQHALDVFVLCGGEDQHPLLDLEAFVQGFQQGFD